MQIVSVRKPVDYFGMQQELTEIQYLIEKAKCNGQQTVYVRSLCYHNHLYLIKQRYAIRKFIKRTSIFSFIRKPIKYYVISFPSDTNKRFKQL